MKPEQPVISVRGLSKQYYLGQENYQIFQRLVGKIGTFLGKEPPPRPIIWALKDLDFDIYQGEKVGIIGKNGAGKSTLLKILSRLVYPTEGQAIIRGRITSLLEVGTGFNPNLSGKENIYLNASLHGLQPQEVDAIYEDVVDFSEVRRFIDTPVKHYSSGMRMRLAFAVAAHLDPDILLLDEVLAVGDMSFQQKCLQRVEGLTSEGRTVLFVSHSLDAVARFCDRCIWLDQGKLLEDGPTTEVLTHYVEKVMKISSQWQEKPAETTTEVVEPETKQREFQLVGVSIINQQGERVTTVPVYEAVGIEVIYDLFKVEKNIQPAFHVKTEKNLFAFAIAYTDPQNIYGVSQPGRYRAIAWIPANLLNIGLMYVTLVMVTPDPFEEHLIIEKAVSFHVHETEGVKNTARGLFARDFPGAVRPLIKWETQYLQPADSHPSPTEKIT